MKKSLTGVVTLLAGAFVAHSQGTVSFGNYLVLSPYIYVSLGPTTIGGSWADTTKLGGSSTVTTGNPVSDVGNGNDWTVALFGYVGTGDSAASIFAEDGNTPLATASLETGNPNIDSQPGTWFSTAVAVIPGAASSGVAVSLQLAAWYNDGGTLTSLGAAAAAGGVFGLSAVATAITGGPSPTRGYPPATAPNLPSGLGNIELSNYLIPEPSTIALGVMGASVFLLRLRKKQ